MLPLLIDENFDQRILRGLRLRLPQLDYLIAQDVGLRGLDDPSLLEWAAREGRVIVTHDVNTMTKFSSERLKRLFEMPEIIIVPEDLEIGRAIDDLEVIIECSTTADLENQIQYVPIEFTSALPIASRRSFCRLVVTTTLPAARISFHQATLIHTDLETPSSNLLIT